MRQPSAAARLLLAFLAVWQTLISPLYPPCCRFHPTCSGYCRQAVQTHGALRGMLLGLYRLSRCHPLGGQGWDPVPPAGTRLLRHFGTSATRRTDAKQQSTQ